MTQEVEFGVSSVQVAGLGVSSSQLSDGCASGVQIVVGKLGDTDGEMDGEALGEIDGLRLGEADGLIDTDGD